MRNRNHLPVVIGSAVCVLLGVSIAFASTTKPANAAAAAGAKPKPKLTPAEMKNTTLITCEPQAFEFRIPSDWKQSQFDPANGRYEYFMTVPRSGSSRSAPSNSRSAGNNRGGRNARNGTGGGSGSGGTSGAPDTSTPPPSSDAETIGVSFEMSAGKPCHGDPSVDAQVKAVRERVPGATIVKDEETTLDGRPAHLIVTETETSGTSRNLQTGETKVIKEKSREHHVVAVIEGKVYDIWFFGAADSYVKAQRQFAQVLTSFTFTSDPTTRPAAAE